MSFDDPTEQLPHETMSELVYGKRPKLPWNTFAIVVGALWVLVAVFCFVGCGSVTTAAISFQEGGQSDASVDVDVVAPTIDASTEVDTRVTSDSAGEDIVSLPGACLWDPAYPHAVKPCTDPGYAECFYTRPDGTPDGWKTDCHEDGRLCILNCNTLPNTGDTTMDTQAQNDLGNTNGNMTDVLQTTPATFMVRVDQVLDPVFNSRISLDDDRTLALANSLKASGQKQPVEVEEAGTNERGTLYRLHFGSRRLAACKLAGIPEILVTLAPALTDLDQAYVNLEENLQREDLTVFERARGIDKLRSAGAKNVDAAKRLGISKQYYSNLATVFVKLPQNILDAWEKASLLQAEGEDAKHTAEERALIKACAWGFLLNDVSKCKTQEEMTAMFEGAVATLVAEENAEDSGDDGDDDGDEETPKKKGKGKRSSAKDTVYKFTSKTLADLKDALKRSGNKLAMDAVQYLAGERKKLTVGEVTLPKVEVKAPKKG